MTVSVMLDTNAMSELMRQPRGPIQRRLRFIDRDGACVSIVTAAELRYGANKSGRSDIAAAVEGVLQAVPVMPFDLPADMRYGELRTHLERLGVPIGPNDLLIASHALALDLTLVTGNVREFSRVPGLRVENWLD
jgi:tRNA(fMet)-specific endonuclease VapC